MVADNIFTFRDVDAMKKTLQRRSPYKNSLFRVLFRIQSLFSVIILVSAECGFYLAQSTIPGRGLGTFAGQGYRPGDIIGQPGIVIPVIDYRAHHPELEQYETFLNRIVGVCKSFHI